MRHGKSSWDYDLPDDQRPLKPRGYRDSELIAEAFTSLKIPLDKVYSSPAVRAHETCKNFLKLSGNTDKTPQIIDRLYDFRGDQVLNFVKSLPDDEQN